MGPRNAPFATIASTNRVEPSPATWAFPPEGFSEGIPIEPLSRAPADFLPKILEYRRPFTIRQPGLLAVGLERFRRFASPIPPGLRVDAAWLGQAVAPSASVTGLRVWEPRQVPFEPGLLNRGTFEMATFHRISGGLSGIPSAMPPGADVLAYCPKGELVEGVALWAVVTELLADEFAPADLDLFAAHPQIGSESLPAVALEVVTEGQKTLSARQLEALMRSLAGKLKGWSKTDTTSPFAIQLFADAVTDAITRAKPSELPELVARLLPRDSATAAGEGA